MIRREPHRDRRRASRLDYPAPIGLDPGRSFVRPTRSHGKRSWWISTACCAAGLATSPMERGSWRIGRSITTSGNGPGTSCGGGTRSLREGRGASPPDVVFGELGVFQLRRFHLEPPVHARV